MESGVLRTRGSAVLTLALGLLFASTAHAESSEVAALRKEVKTLTNVVLRLEGRVGQLERQLAAGAESPPRAVASPQAPTPPRLAAAPADAPTPPPTPPTVARDPIRDHWHGISRGMTTQAVEALLGRPQRTMTVNTQTVWYYTYPDVGSGSVVFAYDGTVIDWQTPPFSTWW